MADAPHELVTLNSAVESRYLRITNTGAIDGKFSLSGFRVFGQPADGGSLPETVSRITVKRNSGDARRIQLVWKKCDHADGYILRWGVSSNRLNNAVMLYSNSFNAGYFNRDSKYYFSVDAFNENGITPGKSVIGDDNFALPAQEGTSGPLSVFPNPSDGVFNVKLPSSGMLTLSDLHGRRLYADYSEKTDTRIDASGYAKGCYVLSFLSERQCNTMKLIKR
jgi:hypothetical protein